MIKHSSDAPLPGGAKVSSAEWDDAHVTDVTDGELLFAQGGDVVGSSDLAWDDAYKVLTAKSVDAHHVHLKYPFVDVHPFEIESPSGQSQGFVIGASTQVNPGDPYRGDDVFGWGYNRGSGGAPVDASEASLAYVIEAYWNDGSNPPVLEHYLDYGGDDNVGGGRLFFLQIDRATGQIRNFQWNADTTTYYGSDGVTPIATLSDDGIMGLFLADDMQLTSNLGQRTIKQGGATLIYYNADGWLQLSPEDGHVVLGGDKIVGVDEFDIWVGNGVDVYGKPTGPALRYSTDNKWEWSDDGVSFRAFSSIDGELPDPSMVTDGWVLTAESGVAVWAAPPGGGGGPFSGHIEIDDASNPYVLLHKSGGTPQDWYWEVQSDGSMDLYSSTLGDKTLVIQPTGGVSFPHGVTSLGPHAGVSDGSNPYLQLDKTGGTPQTWYLEGQADGSIDLYSGILSGIAWALSSAGVMKTKQIAVGSIPAAGAAQDGIVLVADDGNLYYYSGGSRYQVSGTPV